MLTSFLCRAALPDKGFTAHVIGHTHIHTHVLTSLLCRAALPDKGFTAHVIGYTLHAVLEALVGKLMASRHARHASAMAAVAAGQTEGAEAQPAAECGCLRVI